MIKKVLKILLAVVFAGGIYAGGVWVGYSHPDVLGLEQSQDSARVKTVLTKQSGTGLSTLNETYEQVDFGYFWDVWDLIRSEHVDAPGDTKDLIYGAINGMLQFGFHDQFSAFLPPAINTVASEDLNGSFAGVGIELETQNNRLTIVAPLSETPGEKAGLLAGDVILTIDGESTTDMTTMDAVQKIRGPIGTDVTLGIERQTDGQVQTFDVSVTRGIIDVKSVKWENKGAGIFYIKVRNFAADTIYEWDKAIDEISMQNPKGVILDLRNNTGGYVTGAVHFISEFIPSGIAVIEDKGAGNRSETMVSGEGRLYDTPLVILMNRGTASASEMVAGAMQDYDRATLIGDRSFGKGVLQEIFSYDVKGEEAPASVRIVVAKWFTPEGRNVGFIGLQPDIEVKLTLEQYEAGEDPVMDEALDQLR